MLSHTSRQEIVRKLNSEIGYSFKEENLTPSTRQAITNLAAVQRHLFVITEILRGENSRIESSFILRSASKLGKDSGKTERTAQANEISKLQSEIDAKVSALSTQILAEENARLAGQAPPEYKGNLELVQLKCPSCGAALPMPTGRFITCQYCKATLTIQDVSNQLKSMIQSI
jgi:hypothetical protein